jgi:hypothetical protein
MQLPLPVVVKVKRHGTVRDLRRASACRSHPCSSCSDRRCRAAAPHTAGSDREGTVQSQPPRCSHRHVRSAPAFAVGVGVMMKVTASLTALQLPLPAVVKVSVTVPAVRSAALGVYTAFIVVLFGLYVPVPPLQIAPVEPVKEPFKVIALLFAQTVPFAPASTVGEGVKVITRLSDTAVQLPLPVVVKVSVNVPAASSAGVGV